MNWISVKDNLPPTIKDDEDYTITVLISDGENIGIGYHEFEREYRSDVWHDLSNSLNTCCSGWPKVTHWMPLPKLP